MFRLMSLIITALVTFAAVSRVFAGDIVPFDREFFSRMQQEGRSIVVDVTAPWCPTCKRQRLIIESLAKDPAFADVIVFKVDFDSNKELLREWYVAHQSTLIAFRGKTERLRLNAQTDLTSIRRLFDAAL